MHGEPVCEERVLILPGTMNSVLTIGGAGFRVSSDLDLYYPEEAGPMNVFADPGQVSDVDIFVDIRKGGRNGFDRMEILAEADSAWKLLDDGTHRWFVSSFELSEGVPAWAARMDAGCENVAIDCNVVAGGGRTPNPLLYPLDQLLLIHVLASRNGFIVHGTGVRRGDEVLVFAGVSGAGKTTIAGLLDTNEDLEILSDDRMVIRRQDVCWMAYGTPWPGAGGYALNDAGTLKAVCFLKQGRTNRLTQLEYREMFERMMPVTSVPWYDGESMAGIMSTIESLIMEIAGYDLVFRADGSVVDTVESFLGQL